VYLLMEEIRLKILASPYLSVFLIDLLSDGDFVYSCENLFEILGTLVKSCLICMGTWKFWQSKLFSVRSSLCVDEYVHSIIVCI